MPPVATPLLHRGLLADARRPRELTAGEAGSNPGIPAGAAARLAFGGLTALATTARSLAAARDTAERALAAAAVEDHRDGGERQSALS